MHRDCSKIAPSPFCLRRLQPARTFCLSCSVPACCVALNAHLTDHLRIWSITPLLNYAAHHSRDLSLTKVLPFFTHADHYSQRTSLTLLDTHRSLRSSSIWQDLVFFEHDSPHRKSRVHDSLSAQGFLGQDVVRPWLLSALPGAPCSYGCCCKVTAPNQHCTPAGVITLLLLLLTYYDTMERKVRLCV